MGCSNFSSLLSDVRVTRFWWKNGDDVSFSPHSLTLVLVGSFGEAHNPPLAGTRILTPWFCCDPILNVNFSYLSLSESIFPENPRIAYFIPAFACLPVIPSRMTGPLHKDRSPLSSTHFHLSGPPIRGHRRTAGTTPG